MKERAFSDGGRLFSSLFPGATLGIIEVTALLWVIE
jgi:hypothetical protein